MNRNYPLKYYFLLAICYYFFTPTLFTQTITNGDCITAISIPDFDCVDVSINVTTTGSRLGEDVFLREVKLITPHVFRGDLEMTLSSPNREASVVLMDRTGGDGNDWGVLNESDCDLPLILSEACATRPIDDVLASDGPTGIYAPKESFAQLYDGTVTNPNGVWNLRVCDQKAEHLGSLEYVELIFEPLGCTAPTNVIVSNIESTSVLLNWEDNNNCDGSVIIEYGPAGFTPGNALTPGSQNSQVVVLNCTTSHSLTGLLENTEYDIYVRQTCSAFTYLYNSCELSFITNCTLPPITLEEDFDNQANCDMNGQCVPCPTLGGFWRNALDDDIDWIVNREGTRTDDTGPEDDITQGGQYIYMETSGDCRGNKEAILLSSCINIVANPNVCHFSFFYHMLGRDINELKLEITQDGVNWINLWERTGQQDSLWLQQFIDLSAYNNQTVQFRFIGTSGTNIRGDIALDQIEFYGSQPLETDVLYADKDNDGFGDPTDSLFICFVEAPENFVTNNLDCDDTDASINPDAQELPCNLIDENCNGNEDDVLILNPIVSVDNVCSGSAATLQLTSTRIGRIYWYDSPTGGMPIDSGTTFTTPILTDSVTYYFQEVKDTLGQSCQSDILPIDIPVNPQPNATNASGNQVVCQATDFDLRDLIIQDENDATDTVLFYSSDTYASNSLIEPLVSITDDVVYYIQAVSFLGCTDELSVSFNIEESPIAVIDGLDTMEVCFQSSPQLLMASNDGGGLAPINFEWNVGTQAQEVIVFSDEQDSYQTYAVTITSANGCSSTDSTVVRTLPSISTVEILNIQEPDFCQSNGSIQIAPRDGLAPYGYIWSGPTFGITNNLDAPVYTIPNLGMGAYNITVSDAFGCTRSVPQQIVNGPDLSIDAITDVACNGESNGAIFLSVGGLTNPTFRWTDNENNLIASTEDLLNVPRGVYNVVVDSDNTQPCPLDSIVINEPPVLEVLNITASPPSCAGFNDGAIELTVTGGTPTITNDYAYAWSNGQSVTNELTNVASGLYTASITDANGCQITASGIIENTLPLSVSINRQDPTCTDGDDGQLTAIPTGGTAPYNYQWNDPLRQNTATAFALSSAVYDLTVTDANGCEVFVRDTLFQPAGLVVNFQNITPPSCEGVADGIIDIGVSGGVPPFSYLWSNGDTTERITSILDGIYTVSITDANQCVTIVDSIVIESPSVIAIAFDAIENPTCIGIDDGAIDVNVSGGIAPYRYLWNTNTGSEDLDNLSSGNYFVTVIDGNNCRTISDTATLTANQDISIEEFILVEPISCNGRDNGEVVIQVTSDGVGRAPYSFSWADSILIEDNSQGFWFGSNLAAGFYEIDIENSAGCTFRTAFELTEPAVLVLDTLLIESPSCFGNNDGSIVAIASGGTTPYTYSWTLPNNRVIRTTQNFLQNVDGGDFSVQVIDSSGCISDPQVFSIEEPAPIIVELSSSEPVRCSAPNEGILNINVIGGQMPYSYEWSSGLTSRSINSLDAGTYTVTTTDATECTAVGTFVVEVEETDLQVEVVSIVHKSCGDTADGAITVAVTGGSGRYQYTWSNNVQVTNGDTMVLTNLDQGAYSVTVVDQSEDILCRGIVEDIIIDAGGMLQVTLDDFNATLDCFGDANGAYNISVIGGLSPYEYQWSDGASTEDRQELTAGNYSLTIQDANNCSWISGNFFPPIISPDNSLQINRVNITPSSLCAGESTGRISVIASGGTQQYNYLWNTGATTSTIQDLSAGNYSLTVTDRNDCTVQLDTAITQIDAPLAVQVIANNPDCDDNLGSIQTTTTCGTSPYTYLWSTGDTTPILENLPSGTYQLTVTDAVGTQLVESVALRGANPMQLTNVDIDYRNCSGYIGIDIIGGVTNSFLYTWRDEADNIVSTNADAANLLPGNYSVRVEDANNCSLEAGPFEIQEIPPIEAVQSTVDFSTSSALGTVSVAEIIGGTPPFTFLWFDDDAGIVGNDSIVRDIPIGEYTVQVTDANGCQASTQQIVTSVSSIPIVESFTVYPNPAHHIAFLDITVEENALLEAVLIDALGKTVWNQSFNIHQQLKYPIDFSNLSTGIFYLKLKINDYPPFGEKILHLKN